MADSTTTVVDQHDIEKVLPTTFLTSEEAELLRQYQRWGELNHLYATMKCRHCGEATEVYVQANIGFFCGCRVLIWQPS